MTHALLATVCFTWHEHMRKPEDLAGQVFNNCLVVGLVVGDCTRWLVRCISCGREKVTRTALVKRHGCRRCHNAHMSHGLCGTGTYNTWQGMLARCLNKNDPRYPSYGGRGIKVCEQWLTFDGFLIDMGERPAGMTIDRIDNDKGYCPDNCRWADNMQQANNKRTNVTLTHDGLTMTIAEWALRLAVSHDRLYGRRRRGWGDSKIITTPVRGQRREQ